MTNSYTTTCCSIVDLPTSYLAERGTPYSCFHSRVNGMEYDDDLGKSIPTKDLYKNTRQGAIPTTSQVNSEQYETMFEPTLKGGEDIIHMTPSSGIPGAYNSTVIARGEMLERYPDRQITVIDSCCASTGYGPLVDTAWGMMQADAEYRELVSWIEENKKRVHY